LAISSVVCPSNSVQTFKLNPAIIDATRLLTGENMLVIARRPQETIHLFIGGERVATIMLTETRKGIARIGIEANDYVEILRGEVADQIDAQKQRQNAASTQR
jgi:sRNA-binding carbon storage regulator CsrA